MISYASLNFFSAKRENVTHTHTHSYTGSLRTFFSTGKELICNVKSFQILALINIFDGARNAMTTLIPYYLSYVSKESTDDRSFYIVIMLVGSFFIKLILVVPTQWAVKKYGSKVTSRFQTVDVVGQIFVALAPVILFPISKSGGIITAWLLTREVFKTPHLFFIILAYTWVCDEEVIRTKIAREGLIIGVANMTFQLAGALFGAVLYFGMAGAGLDVKDCREFEDDDDLYEICYQQDVAAQPKGVSDYLYWSFLVAYSVLTVFMALAISKFPIKGERLRVLEERKYSMMNVGDLPEKETFVSTTTDDDGSKLSVSGSVEMGVVSTNKN
jgi:Na+/melibiose symporter-like transporter